MVRVTPPAYPNDQPFNQPVTVTLKDGEEATITFVPEQRGSTFVLPILAMTKEAGTIYKAEDDGSANYGPHEIPPTDIDDTQVTFIPAETFRNKLEVTITNLSGTAHTYHVQPIGYESTREEVQNGA